MILDKEITIKVNPSQLKHFRSIGLTVNSGDTIKIEPSQLNVGSNIPINCKCDVCGKEKQHSYRRYIRSVNNGGYYSCSTKCAKEKTKNTYIEKYGEEHHFRTEKTKNKIKQTMLKNYGTEHFSHSDTYRNNVDNIKSKRVETTNKAYINKTKNLINIENGTYTLRCDGHNGNYEIDSKLYHNRVRIGCPTCTTCYPINENVSIKEKAVLDFICDNYKGEVKPNHKVNNTEIDIYLPKLKLGFEFNGLYWHNEKYKPNDYHKNKTDFFKKKGIKLIHIYEDDWVYKEDIVKSRIINIIGRSERIFARKCVIKELTPPQSRKFLDKNHIQGNVNAKIKLGLYYNGELVSVMTFGKLRKVMGSKSKVGEYEMLRFCNKLNTTVVGGASKLFKYFLRNYKPKNVISYADRSWSDGNLYRNLGFTFTKVTHPNYHYIVDKKRYYRYNFRKDKLVSEGYDPNKSEKQIMLDREIYRIYDSGNLLFNYRYLP